MKSIFSNLVKRMRDVDLKFQAKAERNKDKLTQSWRKTKIKLKKIPFVAFLVKKRNMLRTKFRNSKFYQDCMAKIDKVLTPERRKKLWDIRRSFAYKFLPKLTVLCVALFIALFIANGGTNVSKSSASETKEKKQATTKQVEATVEPTKEVQPTKKPEVEPTPTPDYEPFVPTEDNTKWLEGANKNVFSDKNYKEVKGYKFYYNKGKVASFLGIDVSAHQKEIDWEKVSKTGVKFAMIRVGVRGHKTGKIQVDRYYKYNIENAQKYGIKVGVYFFSQAITTKEALEEANFVLSSIKGYKLDMPVVFDTEYVGYKTSRTKLANMSNELRTDIAIAFMEHIKKAGYVPMIYANKNWLEQAIQLSRLNNYFVWFARYNDVPDYKYRYHMWQYTEKGRISGIEGNVDINVCLVNFDNYIKKSTKETTKKQTTNNTATNQNTTNTTNEVTATEKPSDTTTQETKTETDTDAKEDSQVSADTSTEDTTTSTDKDTTAGASSTDSTEQTDSENTETNEAS